MDTTDHPRDINRQGIAWLNDGCPGAPEASMAMDGLTLLGEFTLKGVTAPQRVYGVA
jgi:hypothetical protein